MSARPGSILWFERIVYAGLAAGIGNTLYVAQRAPPPAPAPVASGPLLFGLFMVVALNMLFVWLIAHRASRIAKWIYIGLVGIGFIGLVDLPDILADLGVIATALTLVPYATSLVSIWLLFRPDANRWFEGRAPVDPEIFR